jgi:hypothetical protein
MLVNYNDQIKVLNSIRNGTILEALKLDVKIIDDHIRHKPSNFNIVLGHANVGKTSFILFYMLCYSLKHDLKWLICSTENESYSLIRKLIEYLDEKPINHMTETDFKKHSIWINEHFKFVDNTTMYDYQTALQMFGKVKDEFQYDGILLDPYNALTKNYDMLKNLGGHEYDYQACTEMRMFCKEHKITMWLNTHASTGALRMVHSSDHEFARHEMPPKASDVEGGGKFVNRADDFMVVHRYIGHEYYWTDTMVHIRKVKEMETGGKTTPIDKPIRLTSMVGSVGFVIDGKSIVQMIKESKATYL